MTAAAVCSCHPATSRRSRTRSRVCCSMRTSGRRSPGWGGRAPRTSSTCGATAHAWPSISPPRGDSLLAGAPSPWPTHESPRHGHFVLGPRRGRQVHPRRLAPRRARARAPGLRGLVGRIRDAIVWSKHLRRVLYPVDLAVFLAIRFYVATVRRRVLVTDRYFYDTLVDVADEGGGFWVRVLQRLTPDPDLAVFLEVSPEESYARKGEYSVDYLARRSAAYRRIAPLVPSAVVLPNADLDATCRALERAVEQRLSA